MTTMIKKVARALATELQRQAEPPDFEQYVDARDMQNAILDGEFDLTALARAAIEAMREPTAGMLDTGDVVSGIVDNQDDVRLLYSDMIDAALAEE